MSQRELTGYDNHDALSGQPDEEAYLYNGENEHLVCVSCQPTGARPPAKNTVPPAKTCRWSANSTMGGHELAHSGPARLQYTSDALFTVAVSL